MVQICLPENQGHSFAEIVTWQEKGKSGLNHTTVVNAIGLRAYVAGAALMK